jgi:hypothetical protein
MRTDAFVTNKQLASSSHSLGSMLCGETRSGGRCVIIFTLLPFMSVVSSFVCARAAAVLTDQQTYVYTFFAAK